jgi:hypothetical protein
MNPKMKFKSDIIKLRGMAKNMAVTKEIHYDIVYDHRNKHYRFSDYCSKEESGNWDPLLREI